MFCAKGWSGTSFRHGGSKKVATSGVEKANENGNGQGNGEGDAEAEGKGKSRKEKGRRKKGKGKSAVRPSVPSRPAGKEWGFGLGNLATVGFIVTW